MQTTNTKQRMVPYQQIQNLQSAIPRRNSKHTKEIHSHVISVHCKPFSHNSIRISLHETEKEVISTATHKNLRWDSEVSDTKEKKRPLAASECNVAKFSDILIKKFNLHWTFFNVSNLDFIKKFSPKMPYKSNYCNFSVFHFQNESKFFVENKHGGILTKSGLFFIQCLLVSTLSLLNVLLSCLDCRFCCAFALCTEQEGRSLLMTPEH
jgi:hypothetical protein